MTEQQQQEQQEQQVERHVTPEPKPQTDPQEPRRQSGDEAPAQQGRVFTEAEVNAMMASRLSKHEKAVRKQIEEEQAEARRQADLSAVERAKEIEQKAQAEIDAMRAQLVAAERRSLLAGKVTKPDRVLRLMDDPEKYFPNGSLDEKALAADFPEYLPRAASPQPENAPHRRGQTIDDMIRSKARGE